MFNKKQKLDFDQYQAKNTVEDFPTELFDQISVEQVYEYFASLNEVDVEKQVDVTINNTAEDISTEGFPTELFDQISVEQVYEYFASLNGVDGERQIDVTVNNDVNDMSISAKNSYSHQINTVEPTDTSLKETGVESLYKFYVDRPVSHIYDEKGSDLLYQFYTDQSVNPFHDPCPDPLAGYFKIKMMFNDSHLSSGNYTFRDYPFSCNAYRNIMTVKPDKYVSINKNNDKFIRDQALAYISRAIKLGPKITQIIMVPMQGPLQGHEFNYESIKAYKENTEKQFIAKLHIEPDKNHIFFSEFVNFIRIKAGPSVDFKLEAKIIVIEDKKKIFLNNRFELYNFKKYVTNLAESRSMHVSITEFDNNGVKQSNPINVSIPGANVSTKNDREANKASAISILNEARQQFSNIPPIKKLRSSLFFTNNCYTQPIEDHSVPGQVRTILPLQNFSNSKKV